MTIGIIILCAAILLIFFGLAERFFRKLGIANWLAFLLVLALVIGAVIPNIRIGDAFTMNVSGFLIPVAIVFLFLILIGIGSELTRSILAQLSVAAVTIAVRLIMPDNTQAMIITTSLIIGFLGGTAAYLVSQSRMGVIVGTMGGIVIGDVAVGLINRFVYNKGIVSLGTGGVFNSIIIAVLFGLIMLEAINAIIRATNKKRLNSSALSFEAGEDIHSEAKGKENKKRNNAKHLSEDKKLDSDIEFEEFGEYNDYFDDKLL